MEVMIDKVPHVRFNTRVRDESVGGDNPYKWEIVTTNDLFLGKSENGREEMVIEATSRTAFRKGNWALIPPYEGPEVNTLVKIELGNYDYYQLYNLKEDIRQKNNLAKSNPEKLEELIIAYEIIRGNKNRAIQQLELK